MNLNVIRPSINLSYKLVLVLSNTIIVTVNHGFCMNLCGNIFLGRDVLILIGIILLHTSIL
jgi:hypothetical protein